MQSYVVYHVVYCVINITLSFHYGYISRDKMDTIKVPIMSVIQCTYHNVRHTMYDVYCMYIDIHFTIYNVQCTMFANIIVTIILCPLAESIGNRLERYDTV